MGERKIHESFQQGRPAIKVFNNKETDVGNEDLTDTCTEKHFSPRRLKVH